MGRQRQSRKKKTKWKLFLQYKHWSGTSKANTVMVSEKNSCHSSEKFRELFREQTLVANLVNLNRRPLEILRAIN